MTDSSVSPGRADVPPNDAVSDTWSPHHLNFVLCIMRSRRSRHVLDFRGAAFRQHGQQTVFRVKPKEIGGANATLEGKRRRTLDSRESGCPVLRPEMRKAVNLHTENAEGDAMLRKRHQVFA